MKIKNLLALGLSLAIIFCTLPLTVSASSYSSDYRYWSQGASDTANMRSYGCWVVAQAKLLYETGIEQSSSFNPDVYMNWQINNGYLNSGFYQTNGGYAPVAYAEYKGKSLSYLGKTTSSIENTIWSNISNGYYSIICVTISSGGEHYVMIANSLSSQNGILYWLPPIFVTVGDWCQTYGK